VGETVAREPERRPEPQRRWFEFGHCLTFIAGGLIAPLIGMILTCIRARHEPIKFGPGLIPFALFLHSLGLLFIYFLVALSGWAFYRSAVRPRSLHWSALSGVFATTAPSFWDWGLYLLAFLWPFLGLVLYVPAFRRVTGTSSRWAWVLLFVTNFATVLFVKIG